MYIFKCKGTWIYSGQYNLYLSSTLIKNSIFCCVAPGHWDSRKIKFCAMFSKSSLFKIECSINIETQCLKNIQLYSKPHFHIFTRKKGPLPLLRESPLYCVGHTIKVMFMFSRFCIEDLKKWPLARLITRCCNSSNTNCNTYIKLLESLKC